VYASIGGRVLSAAENTVRVLPSCSTSPRNAKHFDYAIFHNPTNKYPDIHMYAFTTVQLSIDICKTGK